MIDVAIEQTREVREYHEISKLLWVPESWYLTLALRKRNQSINQSINHSGWGRLAPVNSLVPAPSLFWKLVVLLPETRHQESSFSWTLYQLNGSIAPSVFLVQQILTSVSLDYEKSVILVATKAQEKYTRPRETQKRGGAPLESRVLRSLRASLCFARTGLPLITKLKFPWFFTIFK